MPLPPPKWPITIVAWTNSAEGGWWQPKEQYLAKTILQLNPPRLAEVKQPGQTYTFWSTWFLPPQEGGDSEGWTLCGLGEGGGNLPCCSLFRTWGSFPSRAPSFKARSWRENSDVAGIPLICSLGRMVGGVGQGQSVGCQMGPSLKP